MIQKKSKDKDKKEQRLKRTKESLIKNALRVMIFVFVLTFFFLLKGCSSLNPSFDLHTIQTFEEIALSLNCRPDYNHEQRSILKLMDIDTACDLKIEALHYLQLAYTLKRWPNSKEDRRENEFEVMFKPEDLTIEDISSSVRFWDFRPANFFRGPSRVTAELSSGTPIVFCGLKVRACSDRRNCLYNEGCYYN